MELAAIMPMVSRICTVMTFSKWDSARPVKVAEESTAKRRIIVRIKAKVKKKKNRINQLFTIYPNARSALRISTLTKKRKSLTISPAATLFA